MKIIIYKGVITRSVRVCPECGGSGYSWPDGGQYPRCGGLGEID